MKTILFVCTGNTCRSSMAEGFFNAAVKKDKALQNEYISESAGISAYEGSPASTHSINIMKKLWSIDIKDHRASIVSENKMSGAVLVLTMTRSHKDIILSAFPEMKDKVFTLMEYVSGKQIDKAVRDYDYTLDIIDPYGMNEQVYQKCAQDIKEAVDSLVEKLETDNLTQ